MLEIIWFVILAVVGVINLIFNDEILKRDYACIWIVALSCLLKIIFNI
jgi:K+ transporter